MAEHNEINGANSIDQERQGPAERRVRVSYVPSGHGLALVIDDAAEHTDTEQTDTGQTDGVLRVSDAVITLEIPTADGRPAVLAWDPAEVTWDAVAAAG